MNLIGDLQTTSPTTNATPWFSQVLSNLSQAAGQWLTLKQQSDIIKLNNARMAQGYAPLSPDDYAAQVRVGLDPSTRNMLIVAGGVVVGLLLWKRR